MQANGKGSITVLHYRSFMLGIHQFLRNHRCPVDPLHKRSVIPLFHRDTTVIRWCPETKFWDIGHHRVQRPHSRQVTGARCTEVAAHQSWAEYSSRPTMNSMHQGWAIKDFSVLSEMRSICEQPFYDIILIILHINKSCVLISKQNL